MPNKRCVTLSVLHCYCSVGRRLHHYTCYILFGCLSCNMIVRFEAAAKVLLGRQRMYNCLSTICDLLVSAPRKMMLAEFGLLPWQDVGAIRLSKIAWLLCL
ncbi:hypothetical protein ABBQ38_013956 [Trebouxia sp. C0009 RCD-2024]